jgi:hypothetical protein
MKLLGKTTTTNQINTNPPSGEGDITSTNIIYNETEYQVVQDNKQSNDERSAVDSVAENFYSNVRTRSVIEPVAQYNKFPAIKSLPPKLEMDYSRILNKPFFIKNVPWAASVVGGTLLSSIKIPLDILANKLALIPFNSSVFYRAKVTIFLQASGTPMHSGTVIAAAMPIGFSGPSTNISSIGSFMAAPHVFLSANQATSVALEVPFYVNGVLELTDIDGTTISPYARNVNYAEIDIMVLNQLGVGGGTSTLSISVHAMFNELEFYVPHVDPTWVAAPVFIAEGFFDDIASSATRAIDGLFSIGKKFTGDFLDAGRRGIRSLTGLHNPNHPALKGKLAVTLRQHVNPTDVGVQFEKLDPYYDHNRICTDYLFDTSHDEMEILHILKKPQYLGTFTVANTDVAGTVCWSRPITPIQQYTEGTYVDNDVPGMVSVPTTVSYNLMQNIARLSKFWKGSINIHIQSSMNNFQYCKLAVARNYSNVTAALTSYPAFSDVANLMTEYLEFSAGGQIQTLTMPYCSALSQLPISHDWALNAMSHGIYYVYLNQPLVYNTTGTTNASFNVYISAGDDFELFGYATESVVVGYVNPLGANPLFADDGDDPAAIEEEEEFLAEAAISEAIPTQEELSNNKANIDHHRLMPIGDMRPITHTRDVIRRMYRVFTQKITNAQSAPVIFFDVAQLLGVRYRGFNVADRQRMVTTLDYINTFFLGYAGGARFKILIGGTTSAQVYYVPPGYRLWKESTATPTTYWVGASPSGVFTNTAAAALVKATMGEPWRYYDEAGLSATPHPSFLANTVSQERPNYINNASNLVTNLAAGPTGDEEIAHANCMLEIEVPNMSPYRFVGDITHINGAQTQVLANTPTSNLGHLALVIPSPSLATPGSTQDKLAVEIDIYASADDVARQGYQVFCPILYLPAVSNAPSTGGTVQISNVAQIATTSTEPLSYSRKNTVTGPYITKS